MNQEIPLVSVVMLVYNHDSTLEKSLRSVLNQDVDFPCELIISNDCSTDRSKEKIVESLEKYTNENFNVRVFHQDKNIGLGRNWKFCNDQSKGHYIAVCEGDDYWIDDHKLKKQKDILDKDKEIGIVCGAHKIIAENGDILEGRKSNIKEGYYDLEDIQKRNFISTCTTMFRNNILQFDEKMFDQVLQDFISWNVILSKEYRLYYINKKIAVQHVLLEGSYSTKYRYEKMQYYISALDYLIKRKGIRNKRFLKKTVVSTSLKLGVKFSELSKSDLSRQYLIKAISSYSPFHSIRSKVLALYYLMNSQFSV